MTLRTTENDVFAEFLDHNVILVVMLIVVAAAGTFLGVVGYKQERHAVAAGVIALLFALAVLGIGIAQRHALVDASVFAARANGLSRADRERIIASKIADAGYALEFSLLSALAPLAAGGLSIVRGFRGSRTRRPSSAM